MIRISVELNNTVENSEQRTTAFQKVYDPMTGYLDLLKDFEKSLKAFYGIQEENKVADSTGN
jgi:hypothetical protein